MTRRSGGTTAVRLPRSWSHEGRSLYRSARAENELSSERLVESLHATARSAGRDVDVVEDGTRLVVRLPLPEGEPTRADTEVCQRLDEVLVGKADVPGAE
jgi:hypothetical protein